MTNLIIGILFSFLFTLITLPILIKFASFHQLYVPESYRRVHHTKVSALGGISIFVSAIISFLLFSDIINFPDYRYVIGSGFLMFAIGFYDDLFDLKAHHKLLGQFISVVLLVVFADVRIHFLQNHFDQNTGLFLDYILTVILMLLIINSYNLIDGVDMLAASIGTIIMGFLGVWFFLVGQFDYSLALLALSSSLIAFMIYNYSPAKIFMGDTGTMSIGLIMAIGLIQFDEINRLVDELYQFNNAPAIAFSFIALISFDLIRVALVRIFRNTSPFNPDKNHIHHLLMRLNMAQNRIFIPLSLVIIFQILLTVLLDAFVNSNIILVAVNVTYDLIFYAFILVLLKVKSHLK